MPDLGQDLGPDLGPDLGRTPLVVTTSAAAAVAPPALSSHVLALLDTIQASYVTAEAAARLAALAALPGILVGGDGSPGNTQYGFGSGPAIVSGYPPLQAMIAQAQPDLINKSIYTGFFSWLDGYFAANTASLIGPGGKPAVALDLYASYQNAQQRSSFLVGPGVAALYFLYRVKSAASLMTPGNVFAPVTRFGTATVGANAALAYTSLAAIRTANDTVNLLQGYTPAPGLSAFVTAAITGTLTITVVANGQDAAGNAVTNRVWTAVLDNLAAYAAPVPLVPQNAGDRISQVVTVTGAGTAAGGAFTLTSTFERAVGGAPPAQAAGTLRFIALEMPTGAVNGVNTVFTALHTPVGGMQVSLNGQQQDPATVAQGGLGQVTVSGAQVTFTAAPVNGDSVRLSYFTNS